jgi:hypothetical protein
MAICARVIHLHLKPFSYSQYSLYVPIMPNVFTPRLPFPSRRYRGSGAPYFAAAARAANIWIQCQLREISAVFGKGRALFGWGLFYQGAGCVMIAFR